MPKHRYYLLVSSIGHFSDKEPAKKFTLQDLRQVKQTLESARPNLELIAETLSEDQEILYYDTFLVGRGLALKLHKIVSDILIEQRWNIVVQVGED